MFPIMSAFGILALTATYFYPYRPRPGPRPAGGSCEHPWLARVGLVELTGDYSLEEEEERKEVVDGRARAYEVRLEVTAIPYLLCNFQAVDMTEIRGKS